MDDFWDDEPAGALGTVLTDDRGSLPFLLVHGEALAAAAAWALGEAGVTIVDQTVPWSALVEAAEPFVLHDSLCPLTPPDFIAACVERSAATGAVVVGVRPVTDTVKQVAGGYVGATVDRETLLLVCSPVVLPGAVVATLDALPTHDLTELVAALRASHEVVTVEAPPTAARVSGPDDVRLLESLRDG
ncbi:2-C-methyl-D-erythritol 4-phosphate cytidylyltransferase [Nocardioides sp.]|uniref:2-C-methyl-D-erythritol 4-phosphate cytidylyltransferase n=1 Tax=Nocardioides sp. TaxID=35761 RepID=UPI00272746B6|nr:2-C-methyl-D-erythritol 4-phosphate cytidylyltransferase [Nocardioides sp.]MDO9455139.1 2-C-methyl-D-erythritol 4-phosphate cytidylyltransferase [Nocardioides sp.]